MTLLLNNDEIARLITMRDCVELLDDGYREHGLGPRAADRMVFTGYVDVTAANWPRPLPTNSYRDR